eukprot:1140657-Pelagomonas_calceolata.AAC.2
MPSTSARCPLCTEMDSIKHVVLRRPNPTMSGMHTNRHHEGLSSSVKALSKGKYGQPLLDIVVPESISRAIPDWLFPNGTGSSALHQSRPDAVIVHSIPGRPSHTDPTKILPQDRDIHLVEFKFCPDTNPFPNLEAASAQHTNTITRLKTRSSRNPTRNNRVTLHIILVGVTGTIYNDYTIQPFINLGLTRQKAKSLGSKHALHFRGASGGGVAGRVAVESRRRRVWASKSMADNPPDPH